MDMVAVHKESRRFHMHNEILPGTTVLDKQELLVNFHNHGKQIARNSDGIWFAAALPSLTVADSAITYCTAVGASVIECWCHPPNRLGHGVLRLIFGMPLSRRA